VQEILPYQEIASVPCAPDYVKGLLNLRGQILTVIDLKSRLGIEQSEQEEAGTNLIVNSDEGPISLLVDTIGNVVDIPADHLLPPPGTIRGVAVKYIQEVCHSEDTLLIILNIQNILQG
jgi:purine-binding chemotaxis protein CheW